MKSSHEPPTIAGRSAEITPIANGLRRANKAVSQKPKPQQIVATECGSGWYHDAAIQHLKDIH